MYLTCTGDCNTDADRVLSGLEPSSDDNNSPSIIVDAEEDTSDAIADSDIDDSPSDLEEDSSTREAYTKLYRMADVTIYDSYLLAFQYATRHSLTKTAFAELLLNFRVSSCICSFSKECPQDKDLFFRSVSTCISYCS